MRERAKRPPEEKAELRPLPPARSEEELIKRGSGIAMNLAIEKMRNGTASSQIIVQFMKMGSPKEQLEIEKIQNEIELLKAKKKDIESAEERNRQYEEVIAAITSYSGKDGEWEEIPDDYPV